MTATPGPLTHPRAQQVTDLLDPKAWIIAVTLGIGWHSAHLTGLVWGLFGIVFAAVIPSAVIRYRMRQGRVADRHLGVRRQRLAVMPVITASVAIAIVGMLLFGAPSEMIALIAAMLVTLVVLMLITTQWKISVHSAVSAGAVAMLTLAYGPIPLAGYALVALVGWSRIMLKDHTPAQVIAGTILGTVTAGITYWLIA